MMAIHFAKENNFAPLVLHGRVDAFYLLVTP